MTELLSTNGFRCPGCGQTHEMHHDGQVYTMNKEMTKMFCDGDEMVEEYQCLPDEMFACEPCDENFEFENWVAAFKEPLRFFETENLCHCGGELWMDQIPGTRNYGFVCDDCNWVKPKAVVSGA